MQMDDGMKGWIVNTSKKHHWRVASYIDLDDLVQDGFMHFYRLRAKYPDVVDRPHMMRLLQITFTNWINDLATKRTRHNEVLAEYQALIEDETQHYSLFCDPEVEPAFAVRLARAPAHIKKLLSALSTDEGVRRLSRPYRVFRDHIETRNERLCRIAGVAANSCNICDDLRAYFA